MEPGAGLPCAYALHRVWWRYYSRFETCRSKETFFIPVYVLRDKFKGKFLSHLHDLYLRKKLTFSSGCSSFSDADAWYSFKDSLYKIDWCPYIKETFNGFGNAIEYLGKYTHRIAISNSRIISVSEDKTTFSARVKKPGEPRRTITLDNIEFIRRFLIHVLPKRFQKIRYYGFLNNRSRSKNLELIFKLQGHQKFKSRYTGLTMSELLKQIRDINISFCPACGCCSSLVPKGRIDAITG